MTFVETHPAISEIWGEHAELHIVNAMPVNLETWERIAARSSTLDHSYWTTIQVFQIPTGFHLELVTMKLIDVGRSRHAVHWLGRNLSENPSGELLVHALHMAAKAETSSISKDIMFSHNLGKILDHLEVDPSSCKDEVANFEWIYFQELRYSQRPIKTLYKTLASNPELFVVLIKIIYLPSNDSAIEESPPKDLEYARALAGHAYDILHSWTIVPGSDDKGLIDALSLENWVKQARKLCADARRGEIGDVKIGEILAASLRQPDEPWPSKPVREIIEITRSRALERGLETGTYNRRGVTVRSPFDGGEQECKLAIRYRHDAETLRFDWNRTAACLERIAELYELDARREDQCVELRNW